jgi:hypothetical protein
VMQVKLLWHCFCSLFHKALALAMWCGRISVYICGKYLTSVLLGRSEWLEIEPSTTPGRMTRTNSVPMGYKKIK